MTALTTTISTPALGAEGPSVHGQTGQDLLNAVAVPGRYALCFMGFIAGLLTVRSDLDRLSHMDERSLRDLGLSGTAVAQISAHGL